MAQGCVSGTKGVFDIVKLFRRSVEKFFYSVAGGRTYFKELNASFIQKLYTKAPEGATMLQHIGASLEVALTGYAIGVLVGVPLGILMDWYENVDVFVRPLFDLLRPIPGIAWIPIMIVLFGIGLMSKAMVIFLSAFIACVVNSYSGVRQTKTVHLWVAQTFGAKNHGSTPIFVESRYLEGSRKGQLQFTSHKINDGGKALEGMVAACLAFGSLNH